MVFRIRRAALCASLAAAIAVTGCSSSGDKGDNSPPTTAGSTSTTAGSTSESASGGGGSRPDATTKAIRDAFRVFFNTNTSLAASMAVLQHGVKFRTTLQAESNSPSANDTSAKVSTIVLAGDNVANVKYSIRSAGGPLLTDVPGVAVREGGKWKVAAKTFCALLKLEGTAPPLCDDESVTALPS